MYAKLGISAALLYLVSLLRCINAGPELGPPVRRYYYYNHGDTTTNYRSFNKKQPPTPEERLLTATGLKIQLTCLKTTRAILDTFEIQLGRGYFMFQLMEPDQADGYKFMLILEADEIMKKVAEVENVSLDKIHAYSGGLVAVEYPNEVGKFVPYHSAYSILVHFRDYAKPGLGLGPNSAQHQNLINNKMNHFTLGANNYQNRPGYNPYTMTVTNTMAKFGR